MSLMLPVSCCEGLAWWGLNAKHHDEPQSKGAWDHRGFMQGAQTHIYFWPDRMVMMVILTNGEGQYEDLERELIRKFPFALP